MPPHATTSRDCDFEGFEGRKSRKSVIWRFEPGRSTRAGGLCAQRHARSAHRRAAALLENFEALGEPWQQFPRGGSALRSSTGKIKVGLLVELSIMVPLNHANYDSIRVYLTPQDEPRSPERSGCCSPPPVAYQRFWANCLQRRNGWSRCGPKVFGGLPRPCYVAKVLRHPILGPFNRLRELTTRPYILC